MDNDIEGVLLRGMNRSINGRVDPAMSPDGLMCLDLPNHCDVKRKTITIQFFCTFMIIVSINEFLSSEFNISLQNADLLFHRRTEDMRMRFIVMSWYEKQGFDLGKSRVETSWFQWSCWERGGLNPLTVLIFTNVEVFLLPFLQYSLFVFCL